jgi:PAS domain S-box-containing protein
MTSMWKKLRNLLFARKPPPAQSSQEMLRSVVETVVDGIVTIDARGRIQSFNPAAERIFGYAADEVIGRNVSLLMPEPYRSRHDGYLRNYLASGETHIIGMGREVVGRRKDRSTFSMELTVSEFRLGEEPYFTGVVRDVTGRRQLEEELRSRLQEVADAEERIRSVVDNVVDGIITIDEQAVIHTFNPAAERIFGCTRDEAIGRNVKMLMPEPDRGRHDDYVADYLTTGHAKIIGTGREVVGRRKDGALFPMELAISEFRIGTARYFTGIVRDITERKRLQNELHQKLEQLAVADQRKDQFIGLLGHELRNPLAPVRNGLQILRRSTPAADRVSTIIDMMDRQVGHMVRLIDDLLDISRITSGKITLRRETVDLREVVQQAIDAVGPDIADKAQQLEKDLPQMPLIAYVDPVRIAQVVNNLLNNASKFSERGQCIRLTLERHAEHATIRVKDEGAGVPRDKLDEIFEIFVQVDPSFERRRSGLGIGLTLVKSLVELHGGSVSSSSAGVGKGATFDIRLPATASERAPDTPAASSELTYAHRRVLVVDDNKDAADTLSALLRMLGHEVATAYDGMSGMREAARMQPNAILCDIGMPGMSGFDVARRIRSSDPAHRITLIAVTGYGHPDAVRDAHAAGFDLHLVKPVDLNELTAMLKTISAPH